MNADARIKSFVAAEHDAITTMLADLVAIPTVNPPAQSYRECTDYLAGVLARWGIDHRIVSVAGGDRPRFSIIGSWGAGESGLHLHGHYDVVLAQSPDQFRAERRNERLYGRGTADMKGGIVAMLFALRALQRCGVEPSHAVIGRGSPEVLRSSQLLPALRRQTPVRDWLCLVWVQQTTPCSVAIR